MTASDRRYTVAVRALADFTARRGDLDRRFAPGPTAREGIAGHQAAAARRGAGYEAELTLTGRHRHLDVRGRADGYDPQANRLDEVKTHRGTLDVPAHHQALHQAQLRLYGHLLCEARGLASVTLTRVYVDVATQAETLFTEEQDAGALRAFFVAACDAFVDWADAQIAHQARRDAALAALRFPLPSFRAGQRELARAVYATHRDDRRLLAQAPTGVGKTLATLFAALRVFPATRLDKVFYLTAKTTGRRLALDGVRTLRADDGAPLPLRVLELVARDKACEHPGSRCDGESCPLARGFYDRLADARADALDEPVSDAARLRAVAARHQVCPYYLGQELIRWVDLVVGDVSHWFDPNGLLHALAAGEDWRVSLLVDEAHHLADRAREMYSATLDERRLAHARREAPAPLRRRLDALRRQVRVAAETPDGATRPGDAARSDGVAAPASVAWSGPAPRATYRPLDRPGDALLRALQNFIAATTDLLAEQPAAAGPALTDALFDAIRFAQAAERFGAHSLFDASIDDATPAATRKSRTPTVRVALRNVVPAPFTGPRLALAQAATLFSATLAPWHFHRDTLGLPADTRCLDVPSPFDPGRLAVHVAADVSTRWRDRDAAVPAIVARVVEQFGRRPGNYLVFVSSFAFLRQVADAFVRAAPAVDWCAQSPGMSEAERAAFVDGFVPGGRRIGFAVLGGVFGEGIDLPGDRLVGAFIATLGLPPPDPVNEAIRARMEQVFGDGQRLVYLYPGLQKVVQAAGRVIRSEQDRGVIHLIDDRFARAEVRRLLPSWWRIGEPGAATPAD